MRAVAGAHRLDPREHAVADAGRTVPRSLHHADARWRRGLLPVIGDGERRAIDGDFGHADHGHLGQRAAGVKGAARGTIELPRILHLAQQRFERDAVRAVQRKRARDLALSRQAGRILDEGEDLGGGGEHGTA